MAALLLCVVALACASQLSLSAPSSTQTPLINSWNLGADKKARNPNIADLRKTVASTLSLRQSSEGNATTRLKPWGAAAAADASDLSADDVGEQKLIGPNHPFARLLQQLLTFVGFTPNINFNNPAGTTALGGTAPGNNVVLNPSFFGNGGFLFPFTRGRDAEAKAAEKEGAKQNVSKARVPANRHQEATKDNVKRQNSNRMKQKQQQQQQLKLQQQQLQNSNQGGELFQDDESSQNSQKKLHYYKFVVSRDSADDPKTAGTKEEEEEEEEENIKK